MAQEDQRESSSQCSGYLTRSGRRSMDQPLLSETLSIKADRISKVTTVDIQSGNRQVTERDGGPVLAPATPPRAQGKAVPLRRTAQRRLAAREAAALLAEGAALGGPSSAERPYFKVCILLSSDSAAAPPIAMSPLCLPVDLNDRGWVLLHKTLVPILRLCEIGVSMPSALYCDRYTATLWCAGCPGAPLAAQGAHLQDRGQAQGLGEAAAAGHGAAGCRVLCSGASAQCRYLHECAWQLMSQIVKAWRCEPLLLARLPARGGCGIVWTSRIQCNGLVHQATSLRHDHGFRGTSQSDGSL